MRKLNLYKTLLLTMVSVLISSGLSAQSLEKYKQSRSFNYKGIDVFIKATPAMAYTEISEFKCPSGDDYSGAGGLRRIIGGIDKALLKQKKGKVDAFNAIIANKPGKIMLIMLTEKQATSLGQLANVQTERKTEKLVFVCNYPTAEFDVVQSVKFVEGGLGETYRGGNKLEIMINGFLDKAARKERKAKIEPFDAIYIDPKHLESGFLGVTMNAKLIRFKR